MVRQAPTASELWAIVAAILPSVLMVTIPMGVLVGILTGFSRMSSDKGHRFRASGVPMTQYPPVLVFAVLAAAATSLTVWVP
jgi:lipopolysaccharide export LptBFGC system permease protein LptF